MVKVTAVISRGFTPRSSTSQAMRSTRVPVLPVPGPAITATNGSSAVTAARCWGLRVRVSGALVSAAGALTDAFSSRFAAFFLAGSAPKRESCPWSR